MKLQPEELVVVTGTFSIKDVQAKVTTECSIDVKKNVIFTRFAAIEQAALSPYCSVDISVKSLQIF
jgi:hypothetical protein